MTVAWDFFFFLIIDNWVSQGLATSCIKDKGTLMFGSRIKWANSCAKTCCCEGYIHCKLVRLSNESTAALKTVSSWRLPRASSGLVSSNYLSQAETSVDSLERVYGIWTPELFVKISKSTIIKKILENGGRFH